MTTIVLTLTYSKLDDGRSLENLHVKAALVIHWLLSQLIHVVRFIICGYELVSILVLLFFTFFIKSTTKPFLPDCLKCNVAMILDFTCSRSTGFHLLQRNLPALLKNDKVNYFTFYPQSTRKTS